MITSQKNKEKIRSLILSVLGLVVLGCTPLHVFSSEKTTSAESHEKPGLLILSHGSPSTRWNGPVNELVDKIKQLNKEQKVFQAVEGAFLEFSQPDAKAGIEKLESKGCTRIVVVPAFIFPTSHSHFDVPAVLGIYTSPSVRKTLQEENARIAAPKVPILVTQTISEGDLLDKYVLHEAKKLSRHPEHEALLVLAHGDSTHEGLITPTMKRITSQAAQAVQLADYDWVFCGMGQQYQQDVAPVLKKLSTQNKTVLIIGVYLASSAQSIHNASTKEESKSPFSGIKFTLSTNSVLDYPQTPLFIYEMGVSALKSVINSANQTSL